MTTTYDENNIFAKILKGDIPSVRVYEDDQAIVIMDVMPQSKGHCLVIPRAPSRNILDASDDTLRSILPLVAKIARAAKAGLSADGIMISQLNEPAAQQSVFHLHFHVIPRYDGVPLVEHASVMADTDELRQQAELIKSALDA